MERFKKDNFLLIGISHKTAPIEIREKFSFNSEIIPTVLTDINNISGICECMVLSTCNRTEIYAFINKASDDEVRERLERYILDTSGMEKDYLKHFYYHSGRKAIEHLFEVTCGLDSMILGETQILGQVKNSYALACDNGCTGQALNCLLHQAFQVRKQIRNSTSIGEGVVSISSAAVLLASKVFGSLNKRKVLLVGAGKIGKLCAKQLIDSGIDEISITNRTIERASALAEELSGKVIPFNKMAKMFDKVDIVITSATSTTPLITKSLLKKHIKLRNGNPLSFIDLGVPRNVDPEVAQIKNIYLFNIDNIEDITMKNMGKRKNETEKAKQIINKRVNEYCVWLKEQEVIPVINSLRKKYEDIRQNELKKINNKVSEETFTAIDLVTRRIVRKILHNPTVMMKSSESGEDRDRLVESINELFINETVN